MKARERADKVETILSQEFGELGPTLIFHSDFECLVAILLSAQTTDLSVNKVSPALFGRFRKPSDFAVAGVEEIRSYIKTLGLSNSKARSLKGLGQWFLERGTEEVPHEMETLVSIPGVGVKTAGVFLIERDRPHSFPVDTHIFRVTGRLGLQRAKDPIKAGTALYRLYPGERAGYMHRAFITLGRRVCEARGPSCEECPLRELCPRLHLGKKASSTALR